MKEILKSVRHLNSNFKWSKGMKVVVRTIQISNSRNQQTSRNSVTRRNETLVKVNNRKYEIN